MYSANNSPNSVKETKQLVSVVFRRLPVSQPMVRCGLCCLLVVSVLGQTPVYSQDSPPNVPVSPVLKLSAIILLDPPEKGFYAKWLDYEGIPIKAAKVVADEALLVARDRLHTLLKNLPNVRHNLRVAGAELHIIGKDQVTSDLPEFQHLKGKPFDGKLTVDERTRGLGGLLTSCGEENLLKLPGDRYAGRDICIHEFAHNIQDYGLSPEVRQKIQEQYQRSVSKGLWKGSYAASNVSEFFAELTMWYFGTHGDLNMVGTKPENGPEGLKKYDPEAYALLNNLYSGRIPVSKQAAKS